MKNDYILSFVLLFQMVVVTLQLIMPLYALATEETAATYRVLVTVFTYLPAIWIVVKRSMPSLFIPFAVYIIVILFHYVLFPDSSKFIESRQAVTLTPIAILTAVIIYNIRNFSVFTNVLLWVSRISPLFALLYVWGRQNLPVELTSSYSMAFGYSMLLPSAFLFTQKSLIDRLLSASLFLMILLAGSRGPVFVLALFILADLLFLSSAKKKMKTIVSLLIIGMVSLPLAYKYFDFESSRTISLFSNNEVISHTSDRDVIYERAMASILESPIWGHGIGSDRLIVGTYCHNIFLEVTLHYGIFVSTILFGLLFYVVLYLYFHPKILEPYGGRRLFVIVFLYGFIPKCVSGSYLIDFSFAMMLGYLFLCLKNSNKGIGKRANF